MFTGLVEEIGTIQSIQKGEKSAKIIIKAQKVLEEVKLGDSIAVNGICLTVTEFTSNVFSVDVMAETMRLTNLSQLKASSKVNLERALQLGSRLGGHIVSGHIDGVGTIQELQKEENAVWVTIGAPDNVLKYVIHKGSIAIDGISLTVAYVDDAILKVSIIPHTKDATTLLTKGKGDLVNLECDVIGKYVEKLLPHKERQDIHKSIDMAFLDKHGFTT